MAVCLSVQSISGMQRLACRDELVWSSIYCDTEKHELLKRAMLHSDIIYIHIVPYKPYCDFISINRAALRYISRDIQ